MAILSRFGSFPLQTHIGFCIALQAGVTYLQGKSVYFARETERTNILFSIVNLVCLGWTTGVLINTLREKHNFSFFDRRSQTGKWNDPKWSAAKTSFAVLVAGCTMVVTPIFLYQLSSRIREDYFCPETDPQDFFTQEPLPYTAEWEAPISEQIGQAIQVGQLIVMIALVCLGTQRKKNLLLTAALGASFYTSTKRHWLKLTNDTDPYHLLTRHIPLLLKGEDRFINPHQEQSVPQRLQDLLGGWGTVTQDNSSEKFLSVVCLAYSLFQLYLVRSQQTNPQFARALHFTQQCLIFTDIAVILAKWVNVNPNSAEIRAAIGLALSLIALIGITFLCTRDAIKNLTQKLQNIIPPKALESLSITKAPPAIYAIISMLFAGRLISNLVAANNAIDLSSAAVDGLALFLLSNLSWIRFKRVYNFPLKGKNITLLNIHKRPLPLLQRISFPEELTQITNQFYLLVPNKKVFSNDKALVEGLKAIYDATSDLFESSAWIRQDIFFFRWKVNFQLQAQVLLPPIKFGGFDLGKWITFFCGNAFLVPGGRKLVLMDVLNT